MRRYRLLIHVCVFVLLVALSFDDTYNPFTANEAAIFPYAVMDVAKNRDSLYEEIQDRRSDYEEAPQNAVIDNVWQKMPGRNGIKVNVDKSYDQMRKGGVFDETLLVYEQIPPEKTMDELPAAPIYRGHPDKDMVSLLINVSWGDEYIPSILNVLKEHQVKATFFIEGKWAMDHSDAVKMINEQGHTIGNHGYNHPDMKRLSGQKINEQLSRTNEIIEAIIGETPQWFAPPSGNYTQDVVDIADQQNMNTILWSVDTIDWKNPTVSVMMNRVMNKIHPGATILMHPTASIDQGLDSLITAIKDKGYKIGTIQSLMSEDR